MDPTETAIQLLTTLQELEIAYTDNPKGESTVLLREDAVGLLNALANWLGPLEGYPPKMSTIELDEDDDD